MKRLGHQYYIEILTDAPQTRDQMTQSQLDALSNLINDARQRFNIGLSHGQSMLLSHFDADTLKIASRYIVKALIELGYTAISDTE